MNVNMILSNSLLLFNLICFAKSILIPSIKSIFARMVCSILIVLLLAYKNYTSDAMIGTCIMTLSYIVYIFIFYSGDAYKKTLVIIFFLLTISFSELLIANFMNILFNLMPEHLNTYIYMIALILSNGLSFIILSIISKFMRLYKVANNSNFMWFSLILPITTLLFLYNFTDYFSTFRNNLITLFIILGLIGSNIIALLAIAKELKRLELSNEIKETKMKYYLLNTQYNTNFYFLHDTIRSLTKLNSHMNEKNFTEFQKEVIALNHSLSKSFNTISSNSELLNTLLNHRITDISKYNINVKTVIEYNDFSFINLEDRLFLFTELLSLSINSCIDIKSNNPRIIIKTKKINQQAIIQCTFSYKESFNIDFMGLRRIVESYNGHISDKVIRNKYYDLVIVFFNS